MTVFVISDLHLGHKNIIKFVNDGVRLRPFESLHEMHNVIVTNWCNVVTDADKVYVLGDVALNKSVGKLILSLPGKKRLVRGNHDLFDDKWYHEAGFKSIYGVRQINGVWLTHVPMHPCSLEGRAIGNIHGHMHMHHVLQQGSMRARDLRYFNACVEQINYTPVSIDDIVKQRGWK